MRRIVAAASLVTNSRIPPQFAKVLRLKDSDDRWVGGWIIETVSDVIVDGGSVPDDGKAIRNHPKLAGDNTPRLKA